MRRPAETCRNSFGPRSWHAGASQIGGKGATYPGGESDLILDPGVPVFKFTDADKNIVHEGGKVRVQGVRNAQGEMVNRVTAMP